MARARAHLRWQGVSLIFADLVCLFAGGLIGAYTRFGTDEITTYVFDHIDGFVVFCSSIIIANYLAGNYRIQNTFSRFNMVVSWLFSILFAMLILSVTSYAWITILIGRGVLFLSIGWYSLLIFIFRQLLYKRIFRSSMFVCRVAALCEASSIAKFKSLLENDWTIPAHRLVACIDICDHEVSQERPRLVEGVPVIQTTLESFDDVMRGLDVSLIILAEDREETSRLLWPRLRRLRFEGFEVMNELVVCETYAGRTPLHLLTEDSMMEATLESSLPMVGRFKRVLDLVIGGAFLLFFAPLMLVIWLLVKLSDPASPALYTQVRVGRFGELFKIIKFRTMVPEAETESGAVWAEKDDPRITRLGLFLRTTRLDELPQFINVLLGHMSLVGPRPERPEIVRELEEQIPFFSERAHVVPGLTGWAQIRYPYGSSVEDARRKLELDFYYIKHMSIRLDMQIILSTLRIMVLGKERSR